MENTVRLESGYSACSPVLINGANGDIWAILSLYGNPPKFHDGSILAVSVMAPDRRLQITSEPSIYGTIDAKMDLYGNTWITYAERIGSGSRVILTGFANDEVFDPIDITNGLGKHESPRLVVCNDGVWVVWNTHSNGSSQIYTRKIFTNRDRILITDTIEVSDQGGRCYRPCPIVDENGQLYIFYEAFFGGRYHLIARAFEQSRSRFTRPVRIGFDKGNDQAATVCISDGKPLVVWENSEPLYKGYVYPPMPEIIIPGFGHGWRINTRLGARRVQYNDGDWALEPLIESGNDEPLIHVDKPGFSGATNLIVDPSGQIILSYISFVLGAGMKVCLKMLDGHRWNDIPTPELSVSQRIPAGLACGDDRALFISYLHRCENRIDAMVHTLILPIGDSKPVFCDPQATHQAFDEVFVVPKRREINYNSQKLNVYWGDLHMHSNVSPCSLHEGFHCTELEEKYRFAKDVGNLDFAMITDHDMMSDFEWARTKHEASFHNMPGSFAAFPGFEWTSSMMVDQENFGHRNVLFTDEDPPILRVRDQRSNTPEKLWANLNPDVSITIPHHPSSKEHPFNWDHFDPGFDRLVEIFQVRGADEFDDCPMYPTNFGRAVVRGHSVSEGLKRGYRIGFTSGGEHEGVGITAVLASDLSRQSIFDALKARRTYGTTGTRILIDFRINGHIMGEEMPVIATPTMTLMADAPCDIRNIRLMRDGVSAHEWNNQSAHTEIYWVDEWLNGEHLNENHYYYVVITQSDGEMAWSSPIFLVR